MPRDATTSNRRGTGTRSLRLLLLTVALLDAPLVGCKEDARDRSKEPAYMCPRLVEKCKECRARIPGFDEWDCNGSDGAILERCKGKAAARPPWLEKLGRALALESCHEFEEAL
ncbi:MAG: hypothetical protein JXB32_15600 [Deltaproteobacteria bacterium]|nr:hypothetical protein [Deltaproteobacteria bacterium]